MHCEIDKKYRMENSRQHTGQHVLSGVISRLFGAASSSFKINEDLSTIEINQKFTKQQVEQVDEEVSKIISDDIPVTIEIIEDQAKVPATIRKKYDFLPIRIVSVEGIDQCPCCGTHCASTSQLLQFKLFQTESVSGGTKLYFAFGNRCAKRIANKCKILQNICDRFTCGEELVEKNVENACADLKQTQKLYQEILRNVGTKWAAQSVIEIGSHKLLIVPYQISDAGAQTLLGALTKQYKQGIIVFYEKGITTLVVNDQDGENIVQTMKEKLDKFVVKCGGAKTRWSITLSKKLSEKEIKELLQ